jgi:hypothetical protein
MTCCIRSRRCSLDRWPSRFSCAATRSYPGEGRLGGLGLGLGVEVWGWVRVTARARVGVELALLPPPPRRARRQGLLQLLALGRAPGGVVAQPLGRVQVPLVGGWGFGLGLGVGVGVGVGSGVRVGFGVRVRG